MAEDRRRRQGNRGQASGRRDTRAREAERHIAAMASRFGREIESSVAGIRAYDGIPRGKNAPRPVAAPVAPEVEGEPEAASALEVSTLAAEDSVTGVPAAGETPTTEAEAVPAEPALPLPKISVVAQDSVTAILERGRGRAQFCDLAVLDFASFVSPGGGYDRGAWAQEEALCGESFLYNVLTTQRSWYGENRRRNINCELYRNRALAVPAVRFSRDKVHAYADVIVAAAPNARRAREEYRVDDAALITALNERIRLVLAIADDLGHEKLILGAFGCGVFGWDAQLVAEAFRAELARGTHVATEVIFAIPRTSYEEHLAVFEHAFATFPERNPETYADAAARAASAREASAAEEDDEDEDDWRRYL
ncbi:TIGR02452 family protein [Collinsella vaginalis]|uniref:TIGR02452 family protein n=1 Tax=Collinsella vaginalis TaxID=1870987 RepID=UPI000A26E294|nr:TIGR02452 family protein [Collinsella vaginalis]